MKKLGENNHHSISDFEIKTFPVPYYSIESKEKSFFITTTGLKNSKEDIINLAFSLHSKGNTLEAAKHYKYLISEGYADHLVFLNYGTILKGLGKVNEAEKYMRKAIQYKPDFLEAHFNLGTILRDLGDLKGAEQFTRKAIDLKHDFAEAYYKLGIILRDLGDLDEAQIVTRKAIEINTNFLEAHFNLGIILQDLGDLYEAEIAFRKAIEINPDYSDAYTNLGNILRAQGNFKEAEISTRKAININPVSAQAHNNLGNILRDIGNSKEAELFLRKAIYLSPDFAEAYFNLGTILQDLGNLNEAEIMTRKSIFLKPDHVESLYNLGIIMMEQGDLKEAEIHTRRALQINANHSRAQYNYGNIMRDIGQYKNAINCYQKAIDLNSSLSLAKVALIGSKRDICDWSDLETHNTWIKTLGIEGTAVMPWIFFFFEDNPMRHLKRSKKLFNEKYKSEIKPLSTFKNKKIHIGYFSSDFREHATMYLISSLLELHNKSKFKIFLYSFSPNHDLYTERAKQSGCIFRDIKNLLTSESVELARSDKLDIAIDLKGYTKHCRMNIFSQRVAPIQINFLGYPGTLGTETIDYIIADKIVIPNGHEKYFTEKIIYMPSCFQCNNNKKEISKDPICRQDYHLPENAFVFTCFNANRKISIKEFEIWMNLLKSINGSVLWLYQSNSLATKNLCLEAEKRNVNSNRIIFANKLPLDKHLARHSLGDLGLDTFNCNGHTTTSDALWAGLPVLTKIGKSFASRVSASLLYSLGIPELITHNYRDYEEKAIYIANNPDFLKTLKFKVSTFKLNSPLFNSELYTRNLETIFSDLVNQ